MRVEGALRRPFPCAILGWGAGRGRAEREACRTPPQDIFEQRKAAAN